MAACAPPPLLPSLPAPAVQADSIEHRLFLIGDAGSPAEPVEPVLAALSAAMAEAPSRSTVVFLGDNIYPRGMRPAGDPDRPEDERRVRTEAAAIPPGAAGFFLMGNHDWSRGAGNGWQAVRDQEAFIASMGRASVRAAPGGGCPGPETVDLSPQLRLVLIDTQWWLHGGPKPRDPDSTCPADSMAEVTAAIRHALASAGDRHAIVLGHHPFISGGVHGGHFDWTDHIFPLRAWHSWMWLPLPVIGSLYPLVRGAGVSSQDIPSGVNGAMRDSLNAAFGGLPLAYAGGHDHNLQVLRGDGTRFLLVSGSGYLGHISKAFRTPDTYFARAASGFMRIDVMRNGRVRLGVLEVDETGHAKEVFSMWLVTESR